MFYKVFLLCFSFPATYIPINLISPSEKEAAINHIRKYVNTNHNLFTLTLVMMVYQTPGETTTKKSAISFSHLVL